ncbi:type II toxin-antitoxin system ParD family antitoxin [Methylobacter sp.]|uniref:type II toxin-antitoxin system ParD family antitoxin n=1 Tax=Methylobacter sp. TaxID=2051955 RepID=UPI00248A6BA2|nr:type II toxin-antitoxin system ParD family antitoxin [Methylobacter sp.]MDI1276928.1 type II toxin-antitoxin system ParD family antitoxin [Methylobacter sp.]MDI1359153.1 type II toxin-antitoxin system ParD family antitoxin [Methylobacter sp.]
MHISLTPELEAIIKEKVTSGLYNNASEVIREALRFMKTNEELVNQMKLDHLRSKLAEGERDLIEGRYTELKPEQLSDHFPLLKNRAIDRINQDKKTLC